jgi:PiT family inorganic phosphate transporter
MAVILSLPVLIGLIAVALAFDFLNGLHDSANSIATVVSTRVLRPRYAVMWAAFFNFIAFLVFGVHVAQTVGTGIVAADIVDARVIFSALMGAIAWNLITWWAGIPSSSSHALIGGLVGAGVMRAGGEAIVWKGLLTTSAAIVLSPMTGFFLALMLVLSVSLLFSQGQLGDAFYVPFWVVITCQAAMGLGTLFGGWRIVHTMGSKITRLTPVQGFCAETGGAITVFAATWLGIPVSTTHTITGSVVGVGAAHKVSAVRWNVASNIVIAWVVTLPAAGLMAALLYWLCGLAP